MELYVDLIPTDAALFTAHIQSSFSGRRTRIFMMLKKFQTCLKVIENDLST